MGSILLHRAAGIYRNYIRKRRFVGVSSDSSDGFTGPNREDYSSSAVPPPDPSVTMATAASSPRY